MTEFIFFALYVCVGNLMLVVWPVMLHPTLPARRKLLISIASFVIFVPAALALYVWIGVPQLAISH